uniref:Ig-like domain-containing protein n=1 Tax=Sparus aurata TaxID=8175 RepID=A0A671U9P3_SPAAU
MDSANSCFITVTVVTAANETLAQQDNVLQPEGDVTAAEGEAVTLGCQYNTSSSNYYLFWYKQDGDNSPKFILSRFKIVSGDKTKMHLQISSAAVTDSAVYYCAVRPTVTGNTKTLTFELNR